MEKFVESEEDGCSVVNSHLVTNVCEQINLYQKNITNGELKMFRSLRKLKTYLKSLKRLEKLNTTRTFDAYRKLILCRKTVVAKKDSPAPTIRLKYLIPGNFGLPSYTFVKWIVTSKKLTAINATFRQTSTVVLAPYGIKPLSCTRMCWCVCVCVCWCV